MLFETPGDLLNHLSLVETFWSCFLHLLRQCGFFIFWMSIYCFDFIHILDVKIFSWNVFRIFNSKILFFTYWIENRRPWRSPRPRSPMPRHGLCVTLCIYSLEPNENPIDAEPPLGITNGRRTTDDDGRTIYSPVTNIFIILKIRHWGQYANANEFRRR